MCAIFVVGIQKSRFWNYYTVPLKWSNNKLIRNSKIHGTSCLVLNLLKRRQKYFVFIPQIVDMYDYCEKYNFRSLLPYSFIHFMYHVQYSHDIFVHIKTQGKEFGVR